MRTVMLLAYICLITWIDQGGLNDSVLRSSCQLYPLTPKAHTLSQFQNLAIIDLSDLASTHSLERIFDSPSQTPIDTVYVESWKRGNVDIQEQVITVGFSQNQRSYEAIISDRSGNIKYLLKVDPELIGKDDLRMESYKIKLFEVDKLSKLTKTSSGYDLLMKEQPSHGKHYFPKEDAVSEFYPLENISFFKHGVWGYPISSRRVVKVDGFYCAIRAVKYRISSQKPVIFNSLTLEIEFQNRYEQPERLLPTR